METKAIRDQAGVDAASSYEGAAESLLEMPAEGTEALFPQGGEEGEAQAAPAKGTEGNAGEAGGAKAEEGQAAAAGAEQQGEQQAAAEAGEPQKWAVDQALLDKALVDPVHGAIVKQLHERVQELTKFTEYFQTPELARQALELAPGGVEELRGYVERGRSAALEQAAFASGVPEKQREALLGIAEEMPEQFVAAGPEYMQIWAEKNPESFATFERGRLQASLEADGVPGVLQRFFAAAGGDPENAEQAKAFEAAFGELKGWAENAGLLKAGAAQASGSAGKAAGAKETPEMKALREENAKLKTAAQTRERQEFEGAWKPWSEATNKAVSEAVRKDLTEKLTPFLPSNVEKSFREFVLNGLLDKAEAEIIAQLAHDVAHNQKLNETIGQEAWRKDGEGARTRYVNLQSARAKQIAPHVVAKITAGMTKQVVDAAAQKNEKEKASAAAAGKDVRGHQGGHAPKGKFGVKDVKAGGALAGKTDDEILNS